MHRLISIVLLLLLPLRMLFAIEGMWIPMLLQQLNEAEMKEMGMRINAEDIYAVDQSSIKDAIVLFGRGCTGSIVSDDGLLFTNHHCGFGVIRRHSSVENDYLRNGFWAMNREEELPNPGLTVTRLINMEEVTAKVLNGVEPDMAEWQRKAIINVNSKRISDKARDSTGYDASIRTFYQGNQFYLIYSQTFRDVRLVGTPPSNIGKFGGDSDNWMWPRHTGDFAVFRIYADVKNQPAEYNPDNIPYKPAHHLPVSVKGLEEKDFTMVFGYPGRTNVYHPSFAVELIAEKHNPHKVQLREVRLDIFKRYMESDPQVRIQYASKDASVANGRKKMIGESSGIKRMNAVNIKLDTEKQFQEWADTGDNERRIKYATVLDALAETYKLITPYNLAADYLNEAIRAIEIISFASQFRRLAGLNYANSSGERRLDALLRSYKMQTENFFKDYHQPIDREVAIHLLQLFIENQPADLRPAFVNEINIGYKGDLGLYVKELFDKSIFADKAKVMNLLDNYKPRHSKRLKRDLAFRAANDIQTLFNTRISDMRQQLNTTIDSLQRLYMAGLMEMMPQHRFYPDANFTPRVSYGLTEGYSPADAVYYNYYTSLNGLLEKEDPAVYDYMVHERIKELYLNADYGDYADADGRMRVAFVASNHTTGGSSGSPVLNAEGQLVGINFDRCWEATMSDLIYDPEMCRNISVDIGYVLFIIDKFAGASHLIKEMTLVK